ncbi:MAG TPA: MOSC domain-containing protein [Xanthobacteraceae bacterium]|nr:MOSC domain-containing protein [Xanthobacteraceae bacterium]
MDPLGFRANLYVSGWPAWHEFALLGRSVKVGPEAEIKIVKRIVRCAATNVDPQTGERDLAIPRSLATAFGHGDCGVYGEVVTGGAIAVGDRVTTAALSGPR